MKNAWHPNNEQLAIDPNLQFFSGKDADDDVFIVLTFLVFKRVYFSLSRSDVGTKGNSIS